MISYPVFCLLFAVRLLITENQIVNIRCVRLAMRIVPNLEHTYHLPYLFSFVLPYCASCVRKSQCVWLKPYCMLTKKLHRITNALVFLRERLFVGLKQLSHGNRAAAACDKQIEADAAAEQHCILQRTARNKRAKQQQKRPFACADGTGQRQRRHTDIQHRFHGRNGEKGMRRSRMER